jgi:YHS domain-containing protein
MPMLRSLWFPATVLLVVGLWAYTRFWPDPRHADGMPTQIADAEARELYLTPAGKYTAADIAANGHLTAAQKFRGFRPNHDFDPKPGDRICPVTRTKANPQCAWTVGGKVYLFCCPPCVDEFVRLAKERPEELREPEAYFRR